MDPAATGSKVLCFSLYVPSLEKEWPDLVQRETPTSVIHIPADDASDDEDDAGHHITVLWLWCCCHLDCCSYLKQAHSALNTVAVWSCYPCCGFLLL